MRPFKMHRPWKVSLPPRRADLLAFIEREIEGGRPFPTYSTMARAMGWRNAGSARDACDLLYGDGRLDRQLIQGRYVFSLAKRPAGSK